MRQTLTITTVICVLLIGYKAYYERQEIIKLEEENIQLMEDINKIMKTNNALLEKQLSIYQSTIKLLNK